MRDGTRWKISRFRPCCFPVRVQHNPVEVVRWCGIYADDGVGCVSVSAMRPAGWVVVVVVGAVVEENGISLKEKGRVECSASPSCQR